MLLAFRPVQAAYLVNVAPMSRTLLALLALQSHLTRRLLETLFLLRYPKDARMHGIAYAFSITCAKRPWGGGRGGEGGRGEAGEVLPARVPGPTQRAQREG